MKSILTAIIIFWAFTAAAQTTTEIEYNYMKQGYRDIEEKGLDLKRGYKTENLPSKKPNLKFTSLKRKNGTYAGIIIQWITETSSGKTSTYYVMPAVSIEPNKPSYGWDLFNDEINNMDSNRSKAIFSELSSMLIPVKYSKVYYKRMNKLANQ